MDNDEIRISDLLYTVFKHRKTILVLGLLGFFCGFVFSGVSFCGTAVPTTRSIVPLRSPPNPLQTALYTIILII